MTVDPGFHGGSHGPQPSRKKVPGFRGTIDGFWVLKSDSEDIALPRPGKKSTSTRVLPKIAA